MNIKQKILTGAAAGAMFAAVLAPASALAKTTIKDNGFGSKNHVVKVGATIAGVAQGNNTVAGTNVSSKAKTGKNKVNWNTGGGTSTVTAGASRVETTVEVEGGKNENTASTEGCCCGSEDANAVIKDNGAFSHNGIFIGSLCVDVVLQGNSTVAMTTVNTSANTGGNEAKGNTGGNSSVTTGNATNTTTVTVTGGDNVNQ